MESQVTISETRFDELKGAEKELKDVKYALSCERQKLETATGLLKTKDDEYQNLLKRIEAGCKMCPTAKERDELSASIRTTTPEFPSLVKENDELRAKLEQMTKFRDECERQFQDKCEELASTIADFNALKEEHAKFDMPKPRLQAKVAKLIKENEELKKRINGDCKECVSLDEAKYLGKRLGAADKVISDVLHKVKAHNENFGGPTSDETFKYIEKRITEYQTTTTAESDGVGTLFIEAVDCIRAAFDAWTQEDGTDKSYNKIGEILRKFIESMKKRGGNANG